MAIAIIESQTYDGSYVASHTMSDFDASGTDTIALVGSFNRNPAVEVSGYTIEGSAPTLVVSSTNASNASVVVNRRLIDNAAVTAVTSTPSYKLETMIGIGLSGVDQTTPVASSDGTTGGYGTDATVSKTGSSGNMFLVFIATQSDATITASAGQTVEKNIAGADANMGQCWLGYVACTGSAQTLGGTLGSSDNYRVAVVEIAAAAGGSPTFVPKVIFID